MQKQLKYEEALKKEQQMEIEAIFGELLKTQKKLFRVGFLSLLKIEFRNKKSFLEKICK